MTRKRRTAGKSRRVRTGCLTCRGRHLKCDEAVGRCENCRKSNRICRRGIRLNFIDTQTVAPPQYAIRKMGTALAFRDESRHIASGYVGGSESYPSPELGHSSENDTPLEFDLLGGMDFPVNFNTPFVGTYWDGIDIWANSALHSAFSNHYTPHVPCASTEHLTGDIKSGSHISEPEDLRLLQVFTECVGPWMDSFDVSKYFTNMLPFRAVENPMFLKALMACGARRIHSIDPMYGEHKASDLYHTASQDLLDCLRDPGRDSALCAIASIILSVYEMLSPRHSHSANHVIGARALVKECGWDAKTPGLGGACFWLYSTIELLTCLQPSSSLLWNFDSWNEDMNMDEEQSQAIYNEEIWTHHIVYICAKVTSYRSSMDQFQELDRELDATTISQRCQEWDLYKKWCDQWDTTVPQSMKPLGYIAPPQTGTKSTFPVIWLTRPSAIITQLFYHTTQILLCKTYPITSEHNTEMRNRQQRHAQDICGIITHIKNQSVKLCIARLSLPFLILAAECLAARDNQEEALEIIDHILANETGWGWRGKSQSIEQKIQQAWDWIYLLPPIV